MAAPKLVTVEPPDAAPVERPRERASRWPAAASFAAWLVFLGVAIYLSWSWGWIVSIGIVGALIVLSMGADS